MKAFSLLALISFVLLTAVQVHAQPYWRPVGGPDGIVASAAAQSSSGVLLVANWYGGVFRSSNSGISWERSTVGDFAADYGGMNNAFCRLHGDSVLLALPDQLFLSPDFGLSWEKWGDDGYIWNGTEKFFYTNHGSLLADASYISTDLGLTWENFAIAPYTFRPSLFQPTDSTVLIANGGVLYLFNEQSYTFREIHRFPSALKSFSQDNSGDLYALLWDMYADTTFVFRSTDYGHSWEEMFNGQMWQPKCILRTKSSVMYICDLYFIYRSTDDGHTWTTMIDAGQADFRQLIETPEGGIVVTAFDRGVFYSPDGVNWEWRNNGLNVSMINEIAELVDSSLLVSTQTGVYHSRDRGQTFRRIDELDNPSASIAVNPTNGTVFVSTLFNSCHRSFDTGKSWEKHIITQEQYASKYDRFGNLFLGTSGRVCISRDDGITQTGTSLAGAIGYPQFYELNGASFAITRLGLSAFNYQTKRFELLTSRDTIDINCIARLDDGQLIGGRTNGAIWKSSDNGKTWQSWVVVQSLTFGKITDLIVLPGGICAGAEGWELYFSSDNGKTWIEFRDGLPNGVPVLTLKATTDNYIYAGTRHGLYKSKSPIVSVPMVSSPGDVTLSSIYPNPVTSSAAVSYTLPARSQISLALFDPLGRLVRQVYAGYEDPGSHALSFETRGLRSGVYYLRLETPYGTITKKLVTVE